MLLGGVLQPGLRVVLVCLKRLRLTLTLLVARVAVADHHDATVAANHLAVLADALDAGLNLHVDFFLTRWPRTRRVRRAVPFQHVLRE
jgi:hypothetical protein